MKFVKAISFTFYMRERNCAAGLFGRDSRTPQIRFARVLITFTDPISACTRTHTRTHPVNELLAARLPVVFEGNEVDATPENWRHAREERHRIYRSGSLPGSPAVISAGDSTCLEGVFGPRQ